MKSNNFLKLLGLVIILFFGLSFLIPKKTNSNVALDVDYTKVSQMKLDTVSGVVYIDKYFQGSDTLFKRPEVSSSFRPVLDSLGIKFQDNNFSVLYSPTAIPHKQVFIVFQCNESNGSNNYDLSNGNPIYTAKNTATIPMLIGWKNTKGIYSLAQPSGTTGYITNPSFTSKSALSNSSNANPISSFRLVSLTYTSSTWQNCLYIGGGFNGGLRPLNGHIKRAIFFKEPLSASQDDSLRLSLKAEYGF